MILTVANNTSKKRKTTDIHLYQCFSTTLIPSPILGQVSRWMIVVVSLVRTLAPFGVLWYPDSYSQFPCAFEYVGAFHVDCCFLLVTYLRLLLLSSMQTKSVDERARRIKVQAIILQSIRSRQTESKRKCLPR